MKDGCSAGRFRFALMEVRALLFHKRWLLAIVFLALYSAFTGWQTARIYLAEQQPLFGWQILVMTFGGPFPQASAIEVVKWVSIPTAFLLSVGEPFSASAAPWNHMAMIRLPGRCCFWEGKLAAWYGVGLLFVTVTVGVGALVQTLLLRIGRWELPPLLILGDGFAQGPSLLVIIWVALGLLSAIWWYTTILFICSLVISRPGTAAMVTIVTGYAITIIGANVPTAVPYLRPALGAILNAFSLPGGMINGLAFYGIGLCLAVWLAAGVVVGYFVFRARTL
ncbi:MAG: hypothetical protein AB1330_12545 [Bacillota bacterium]